MVPELSGQGDVMLLEYGTSNFLSFREEAYLDLRPAKSKVISRYPNNYTKLRTGERALKTSVIVGENAGGKSNFVTSLVFLKDLLTRSDLPARTYINTLNSANIASDELGIRDLSKSNTKQEFSVTVATDSRSLRMELVLDFDGVCSESLVVQSERGTAEREVYRVDRDSVVWLSDNRGDDGSMQGKMHCSYSYDPSVGTISSNLMESAAEANLGSGRLAVVWLAMLGEENCQTFVEALTRNTAVARFDGRRIEDDFGAESMASVMGTQDYLDIVRLIDPSIMDIYVDDEQPLMDSSIVRKDASGREFTRQVRDDSAGVRQFLYWSYYIYLVVYQNKTVFADEIDSAINPVLSDRVLAFINGKDHQGQFIFTTHNIFNLTLRTNMKEQINFATKDPATLVSTMYSLADFTDIRYDVKEELYEFYLKGALGGTVDA